ncbi:DNA-binding MarR family transcriptional regulator [Streptomyces sp. B3I7]|nr:DNA-binding MarR family transcriptional regulator [Streptomyces sp. B3I7]
MTGNEGKGPMPGSERPDGGAVPVGDAGSAGEVDDVARAVLTASRLLVAVSARSLDEVEDRITLPRFRMLVVLSTRGETKLVVLAELLQVAPSTAMRMVDRLIAAGLADRRVNPDNRRETLLTLTEEGRQVVDRVMARRRQEVTKIVRRLAPVQRASLIEALTAFGEAGGEPPALTPEETPVRPTGAADLPV